MTFDLTIPELSEKPKNAKDIVITILTYEWPLSIKQIHNRAKKQYSYSGSYQSIYKTLNELSAKEIIIKKGKEYEINVDWVKRVQSFTDIVETNYFAEQEASNLVGLKDSSSNQDIITITFKDIFDAEKYLYYFMKDKLFKKKSRVITYQTNNEWRPIFYLRAEYNYCTRLQKRGHKIYFLSKGNSRIEKEIKKFYTSIGIKYKNTKSSLLNDTVSFLDYAVQIFIPESLREQIRKNLENMDILKLREVLSKESFVKMIITKDKELAKEIQREVLKRF